MIDKIIDVASVDGHIDWKKVKEWGCNGAMLRATIGADRPDTEYVANVAGCIVNGIPFGSYADLFPWQPVGDQAQWFCDYVSLERLPLAWDWELSSGESAWHATVAVWLAGRLTLLHRNVRPLLYLNQDYMVGRVKSIELLTKAFDIWLAWPSSAAEPYTPPGWPWPLLWQYKWHAAVPGVPGGCQVNRWYGPEF